MGEDEQKQEHFLEGLNDGIQYMLTAHTFENFQKMVDKAIVVESKHRKLEEKKRKFNPS